jgi:hypothetical protein
MDKAVTKEFRPVWQRQKGEVTRTLMISLLAIVGLVAALWMMLPSSFTTDVTRIGQGTPVVALIYDGSDSVSINMKYGYKKLRKVYQPNVEFMLINVRSPTGIDFLQKTNAQPGTALYYNAEGDRIHLEQGPKDVAALSESIKTQFGI